MAILVIVADFVHRIKLPLKKYSIISPEKCWEVATKMSSFPQKSRNNECDRNKNVCE